MNRLQQQTVRFLQNRYNLSLYEVDKSGDRIYIALALTKSAKRSHSNIMEFRVTKWGQYTGYRLPSAPIRDYRLPSILTRGRGNDYH